MSDINQVVTTNFTSDKSSCNDHTDCPMSIALDIIGGKWKVIILHQLRGNTLRFGQLRKQIPNITQKTLSQQLKALEQDKLLLRESFHEMPPRVEYTLTTLAEQLNPTLDSLLAWGKEYQKTQG